jgi:hypothetical protein
LGEPEASSSNPLEITKCNKTEKEAFSGGKKVKP